MCWQAGCDPKSFNRTLHIRFFEARLGEAKEAQHVSSLGAGILSNHPVWMDAQPLQTVGTSAVSRSEWMCLGTF